ELAARIDSATQKGVAIAGIVRSGPAHQAGIKPGDILTRIEDKPVDNAAQAINLIAAIKPGSDANVVVMRGRQELELKVKIGERPADAVREEALPR
ncbi:MAG: peptidase and chymotrypsin/Hap, partial [Moraxellaceae bacterium]|nr:peptidase and chymotrypsin/Hap [Moraxellaceae bacterium]